MRLLLDKKFLFILMLGFFYIKAPYACADEMASPISITIQMNKDTFSLPEPIEGKVILTNMSPVNVHAVFDITLSLNGSSQQSYSIAFKTIWPGLTRYSLEDFNIHLPGQAGQWQIVIKQQGLGDDQATTADFVVQPKG